MIEVMRDLPEYVVGFTAHGVVTGADYELVLLPEIEARFRSHAKLRLFYHFAEDFARFEIAAMWHDTCADLRHFRAWEKVVVVTGNGWIRRAARLSALLRPGRARVFTAAQLGEARDWVTA